MSLLNSYDIPSNKLVNSKKSMLQKDKQVDWETWIRRALLQGGDSISWYNSYFGYTV